jgi:RNA recognition motif-containing protein
VQGVDTNANLFVKNIPKNVKEDELDRYFRQHGHILSVKIKYDEKGNSLG